MKSLFGFTPLSDGEIPICEVDGRLHFMDSDYSNISIYTTSVGEVM